MFQRQVKPSFPARNIIILAALVLGLLWFIAQRMAQPSGNAPSEGAVVPTEASEEAGEEKGNKGSGLRPAEWFYAVREYPYFVPSVKTYTEALTSAKKAEQSVQLRGGWPGFSAPWTVQGPGNIGARINCIKAHPRDPRTIYIGYSGGGLWRTADGGTSWRPIFDQQAFLAIGDIELDPQNPEIVYAATGDPNISAYPFIGDGLWKSADGGRTWKHLGLTNQRILSRVIVHPTNSNILYVAAMGLPFERNTQRGLYKSTDGGLTWKQVLYISEQTGIIDMVMSPTDPNVLYAAAWDRIRNNRESVVTGINARVWKTADGGNTWNALGGGLPETDQSRIGLAIDPQNGNRVLASYAGTDLQFKDLYETTDGGNTWKPLPKDGLAPDFQGGFAWYFGKVRINPFNPKDIWLLGVFTFRSTDGGNTWDFAMPFDQDVHVDHHDLYFTGPKTILIATDGGLYRTEDDSQTWQKIENIPTTQFYRVAYNPSQPDLYYGGAQDNGTVAGNNDAMDRWDHIYGGDGFQAVFHPTDPKIYYFEYQNGGIVGTADGGQGFNNATEGIEGEDRRHWDMQYIISRTNPNQMYTGTYRVYQSNGHLPFWKPISPDLTDGIVFGARYHTISTLDDSSLDPDLLYVGTTDGNVWRGNPQTQAWDKISDNLPDRYVSSVKASLNDPDRVFVSFTGYRDNDFTPRVYRSDDRGKTWAAIGGNLPNLAINDLQPISGHQDSVLFAATDGGVYGTLDGGKSWERLGGNFPFVPVYDLTFNAGQRTLVAGSHARSIFSFPMDSLGLGKDVSTENINGQRGPILTVYPSVVNNFAKIKVTNLLTRQSASVFISDLNGRIVWEGEFKGFHTHPLEVPLEHLPPGTYVAFARTGGKVWGHQKFVKVNY